MRNEDIGSLRLVQSIILDLLVSPGKETILMYPGASLLRVKLVKISKAHSALPGTGVLPIDLVVAEEI
jgi:hypothetical protein